MPSLPPSTVQRQRLERERCDVIVEEGQPTADSERRLSRLLFAVKRGDEVLVCGLETFMKSTGELTQLLRDLLEIGASLRILGEPDSQRVLTCRETAGEVLNLLAEHETRRPTRGLVRAPGRIGGGSRKKLSSFQIDYARKLHEEGQSLRMIGLLFQISPDEVWELIGS